MGFCTARASVCLMSGLIGGLLMWGGCKGSSSTGPNPKTTGTLIVTVTPPANASPTILLSGPKTFADTLTTTDTIVGLAAGTYTVAAATAVLANGIVGVLYNGVVTGSPASVAIGDTAVISITFNAVPGSGGLWVAGSAGGQSVAAQYTSAQLTSAAPAGVTLSITGGYVAFDPAGNLWVGDSSANTITEYAAAQLGASGTPTATTTITSGALQGPVGLAFDTLGDLWVSNYDGNTIVEFTASQLATGGNLTPPVVLSGFTLDGPARIAFDSSGNLWIPNAISSTVVALAASSLVASGAPQPAITITNASGSLSAPTGLAFDGQGDLWVANSVGSTIVAYSSGQIAGSGSTTPYETLVIPAATGTPTALAFDNSGDLWANSVTGGAIIEYTGPQISAGGAAAPASVVTVASIPVSLAFDPAPLGLPLVSPLGARAGRHRTSPKL
jgi:sugar lactone lactonase YvrE